MCPPPDEARFGLFVDRYQQFIHEDGVRDRERESRADPNSDAIA